MNIIGTDAITRLIQPGRNSGSENPGVPVGPVDSQAGPADRVEISPAAEILSRQYAAQNERAARIADIRQQIVEGTYDADDEGKHAVVAERMWSDIAGLQ